MKFAPLILASIVASATAFAPGARRPAFFNTALNANVAKLSEPAQQILDKTDVFIFDCDGVIWRGDSLIPGIPETLAKLRAMGKKMFFVTNNSTKSRAGYKKKFTSLGLDIPAEEIFSSSFAAAAYLEQTKFKETGKKVYIVGEVGICEELDLIGVPWTGGPDDANKQPDMGPGGRLEHDSNVGAVIVGFDRFVNYYKIQYAQLCINENPGCEFIATNLDAVTHLTDAQEWAGNGSMVGAIKGCTGQEPTVVGKPSPLMIDYLCTKLGLERSRICMVGDRLDTDVLFGTDNGLQSLLVLSGVTSEQKLLSPENIITPDYYADTINDFFIGAGASAPPAAAAAPPAAGLQPTFPPQAAAQVAPVQPGANRPPAQVAAPPAQAVAPPAQPSTPSPEERVGTSPVDDWSISANP